MKLLLSFPWIWQRSWVKMPPRVPSPITSYLFPAVLPFTALVFSQVPLWFLVGMGLASGVPRDGDPGPELQLCSTKASDSPMQDLPGKSTD